MCNDEFLLKINIKNNHDILCSYYGDFIQPKTFLINRKLNFIYLPTNGCGPFKFLSINSDLLYFLIFLINFKYDFK